ncbi:asparaginase [Knoellia sp. CPCC 206453]|uniref:asparaginase n=1 Tax=Knoellia pratensis TaxID=3404796 RepID=UPI00360AE700
MTLPLASVIRGDFAESRHSGDVILIHRDGAVLDVTGAPELQILPRSTVKPLQALAGLTAGVDLDDRQLAVASGSHTGTDEHVRVVDGLLRRFHLTPADLQCVPDLPEDEATRARLAREGIGPERIRMNCSGKHALMLAACVTSGWSTAGYLDPEHPLQVHVRATIEDITGDRPDHVTVDGCGAPVSTVTLAGLAKGFQRLVTAAPATPQRRVADAMRAHHFLVGGEPHANSDVMARIPGLLAKGGAEGVIAMAAADGAAVAIKVADGNPRATTLIALRSLAALGVDVSAAGDLLDVPVLGGGRPVGRIELAPELGDALAATAGAHPGAR